MKQNWRIRLAGKLTGSGRDFSLTANQQVILDLLSANYVNVEQVLKDLMTSATGPAQAGLVEDVLFIVGCLVYHSVEAHTGNFIEVEHAS